jgi:copper chaperone CopZ
LERLDGVRKARVSFSKGEAYVTYDPSRVTVAQMIAAINRLGFKGGTKEGP